MLGRIQISAELKRWLLTTFRHNSRLFATVHHYSHYSRLFALFVRFAIHYSGFPNTRHDKHLCFLAGKSHPTLLRGFCHSKLSPQTFCHSVPLFATVHDCSLVPVRHCVRLFFETVRNICTIRDYSLRDYSLFSKDPIATEFHIQQDEYVMQQLLSPPILICHYPRLFAPIRD